MIRRPTLHVLAEAAEIGLPETATVPARAFDPVLRPFIAKKVRGAVDAASTRTTSKHGDHLLRVAFLDFLGEAPKDLDPNDERAVEQVFRSLATPYLPPPAAGDPARAAGGAYRVSAADREATSFEDAKRRPRRRWPITVPASIVMLLATVTTVAFFLVPRLLPSAGERFRKTAFGKALGEPLTDVVVAAGRGQADADARAKLLTPDVKRQIGDDAYGSLERVVDEVPHVRADGEEAIDLALAPLYLEFNELDAKLAAAKVPAHLHAYGSAASGKPVVWLTSYFVEQREELTFDATSVRFVWGRRIDGLNFSDSTLYKAHAEDWAVVSMDNVEQEFVQQLLAPLAKGAPMAPDEQVDDKSARAELSRTAGRLISAELVSSTKVSASDAEALHRAIAQRNEIAGSLSKLGYRLPASSGIELSAATVRRITRARDDEPRERALLDDFLRMNARAASHRRDVAAAVAALAHLEEEELGSLIIEQKRLATVPAPKLGERANTPRGRSVAAASLAVLARPQSCPRLALWLLVRPMYEPESYDRTAAHAATSALLERLGLAPHENLFGYGASEAFTLGVTKALELAPERVREAAAATYQDIFDRAPPRFVRKVLP